MIERPLPQTYKCIICVMLFCISLFAMNACKAPMETPMKAPMSIMEKSPTFIPSNEPQDKSITNNKESPFIKLKSIDMGDCIWTDGFWADKVKLAEEVMVPYMGELLTGDIGHSLNNFKIAAGLKEGVHKGMHWHDGDFYKWIEAATYIYSQNKDEAILNQLDEYISIIAKAQEEDGYLQTQVQLRDHINRFQNRQIHEMYNSGHLYTSACVHYRLTGKTNFLNIAIRHADQLYKTFSPQTKDLMRFGFNQTQIIGLVDMYRTTKDKRYLELAEMFINNRGKSKVEPHATANHRTIGDMVQERTPLRKATKAVGHAVLALYYYAGAADVYAETGEQALIDALDRLWEDITHKKMYLTGAVGQAHHGASSQSDGKTDFVHEAFIDEYMMPNSTAYNETCANVCNSMFNYRLLGIHGQSKYADIMELVLYNSALSGISMDGKNYFYTNPLRLKQDVRDYSTLSTESAERTPYIKCFCCPPNLIRTLAKVSGWAYSLAENGISVNLYGGNKLDTKLLNGSVLSIEQKTEYPWKGKVTLEIKKCKSEPFDIYLRIPDWADGAAITINGQKVSSDITAGKFTTLNRAWKRGDIIQLDLQMEVDMIEGHPRIEEVRNQVALKRGPVVYCLESVDLPSNTDILDIYIPSSSPLNIEHKPALLGGVSTIESEVDIRINESDGMYRKLKSPTWKKINTQFVPYYTWANRGKSDMTVWLPVKWN